MKKVLFLMLATAGILMSCSKVPNAVPTITTDKEVYSLGDSIYVSVSMSDNNFECSEWSISSTGDNGPTIIENALFQTPASSSYGYWFVIDSASSPGTLNISVGACNKCSDFESSASCSFLDKSVTVQ